MAKLTVAEFLACKGKRQLTQTFTMDPVQARASHDHITARGAFRFNP